ncbi:MAG: hypothetical protein JNM58_06040 [Xanthomonadaceae bacterium]|nr:hypothetical protein [Xanthomonadaceae bacterium]
MKLAEFMAHHPETIARLEALGYLAAPADIARGTRAYDLGRAVTIARVALSRYLSLDSTAFRCSPAGRNAGAEGVLVQGPAAGLRGGVDSGRRACKACVNS